jgi:hypothetical protein
MFDLYIHSLIRLHSVVVKSLSTDNLRLRQVKRATGVLPMPDYERDLYLAKSIVFTVTEPSWLAWNCSAGGQYIRPPHTWS